MRSKNTRKDIADRLKKAREKAGYASAKNFCQKNVLPLDPYLTHEKGEMPIGSSKALRYCKLLRLSLHELLVGD